MIPQCFRAQIEALMEPGFNTIAQVEEKLSEGEINGWWGRASFLIGFIEEFDAGAKTLRILWGGGNLDEIRDEMRLQVEEYGRTHGCACILVQGRQGWVRALHGCGFRPYSVVVRKEL